MYDHTISVRVIDTEMPNRFGRHVNHDSRSRNYAFRAAAPLVSTVHSRVIPILDQGNLGSCTGNAAIGAIGTSPLIEALPKGTVLDEAKAVDAYSWATEMDPFDGVYPPDDTGSDGLSVAKACKRMNLISGYQWAFTLADALAAIMSYPVITGVNWYEGMDNPDSTGRVRVTGDVLGGHEFEVLGLDVDAKTVLCANSWGRGWGAAGYFTMTWDDWGRLLSEEGDVTVLLPLTVDAPVPVPPEPEPVRGPGRRDVRHGCPQVVGQQAVLVQEDDPDTPQGLAGGEAPVSEIDYGATEHWKQTYRGISVPAERVAFLVQCEGCGCLVGDLSNMITTIARPRA